MKKRIKHYPITGRLIVTRGYCCKVLDIVSHFGDFYITGTMQHESTLYEYFPHFMVWQHGTNSFLNSNLIVPHKCSVNISYPNSNKPPP
jgi:hypothetical protein